MTEEIQPSQINLKSFIPKEELNHKFFKDGVLDSEIRLKLLDIADQYWKDINIDWVKPIDIVITGSIANYNWSSYSDIDLHIIVDFKEIGGKEEVIQGYFDAKKENWNSTHNITIYGYDVEIYVQDIDEDAISSGVYSLETNKWVVEPSKFDNVKFNKRKLTKIASKIMNKIDELVATGNNELLPDGQLDEISDQLYDIFDQLKKLRRSSLKTDEQELSMGNLLWKIMKRCGYIDKIWDNIDKLYDRKMSL